MAAKIVVKGVGVRLRSMVQNRSHWLSVAILLSAISATYAQAPVDELEEAAFKQAAAQAEPSIVQIQTVGGLDLVGEMLTGTGPTTGVIVSDDGLIITSSFNFVGKPTSIIVLQSDGKKYAAEIVATDRARKLTLLKIEADGLIPITPAPKDEVRVGQWSIALGRTYDTSFPSIAVGVVSALNRIYGKAVQTDAKVSPVNYGGPLVDVQGRAIGILVPMSPDEETEAAGVEWYDGGIAFAVPMGDIYAVLPRLRKGESLSPGLLGVSFSDSSPLAGAAKVDRVRPESPAASAGLRVGDVIVDIDGHKIDRIPAMRHYLGGKYAGESITLTFKRGEESKTSTITLVDVLLPYESGFLGILPARQSRSMASTSAEVREVLPDGPAARAGLRKGDQITAIGMEAVDSTDSLLDRVSRIKPGSKVGVTYLRDGQSSRIDVEVVSIPHSEPADIRASTIPDRPATAEPHGKKTGRFEAQLPGDDRTFWMYVPDSYNEEFQYGMVVWIHPPGDTYEAELLKQWQQSCVERGLILVGPRASQIARWSPEDVDSVKGVAEWVVKEYSIDPRRVVVHGHLDAGMSWQVGFRQRAVFRGLAVSGVPLRAPPPDNDPEFRQQILLLAIGDEKRQKSIQETAEGLRELKFPTTQLKGPDKTDYPAALVKQIVLWIDSLDQI